MLDRTSETRKFLYSATAAGLKLGLWSALALRLMGIWVAGF